MSPTTKSLLAGAAVVVSAMSIVFGAYMRDRVDVGGANAPESMPIGGLVASRDSGDVPEGDYFYEISQLLKQRYVEPITDERKLAIGAIRGMVTSLSDPDSVYMDKDEYRVFKNAMVGEYEGIGVHLELEYAHEAPTKARTPGQAVDPEEAILSNLKIPKLTVVSVVPGGPADKAGVKVGDWVEYLDSHWVPNADTVADFRRLERQVSQGKAKMEQLVKVRSELRKRTKKTLLASKAKDRLMIGTEGSVKVVWRRGTASRTTTIERGSSQVPVYLDEGGIIRLSFAKGSADSLRRAVERGKGQVTIDLRNNAAGDFKAMKECLAVLAPTGSYGFLKSAKRTIPLAIGNGNDKPPKITLLVDRSTRGTAEIFALALSSKGLAKLQGSEMSGHLVVIEDNPLPDGSGYTLATARYQVTNK